MIEDNKSMTLKELEDLFDTWVNGDKTSTDIKDALIMKTGNGMTGAIVDFLLSKYGLDTRDDITELSVLFTAFLHVLAKNSDDISGAAEFINTVAEKLSKTASLSYENATLIPNGSNLDYLFASGTYYATRAEGADNWHIANRPVSSPFILYVIQTTGGGRCYQIACTNLTNTPDSKNHKSGIYVRRKIDASLPVEGESDPDDVHALWTKWEMLATRDDIYSRVGNDMNDATEIASGDDLDNYMTNGTYYCASRDIALGVGNTPVDWPFMLHVLRTTGQERFYQIAECHSTVDIDSGIYVRRRIKDGNVARWTDWVHLATLSNALATRGLLQSADDLNEIVDSGIYHFSLSDMPRNSPVNMGGDLIVYNPGRSGGYFVSQEMQTSEGVYYRFQSSVVQDTATGSHWYPWYKIGGVDSRRIRVMQYNMGAFRRGYKSGREGYWTEALDIKSGSLQQALKNYKRFFAKYQPDILGVQEYSRYMGVDDKDLKENSTETCHAWNELFSELYQYVTSKHPESTDPEDAVGSRKLMTNAPIRDIPGLSNYMVSLFGTYQALAEGESPDDYEPLSQIPDYDPVTGEPNFGQVRGLLRNGTVVKGDVKNNAELGECYIGGKKIAIASLAGPNGTTNAALVETYLPGITVSNTAPENPTPSKKWYKTSAAEDEQDLPAGFYEWTSSGWQAFVPDNTPTVALTCKLGVFTQLTDILSSYDNAIIITDSNASVSYNGIDYHTALVEMMARKGYRAAVSIGGYWGAQTTYVKHGEETVFLDHMDEYLNVQDLAARYNIGMYVDEHGKTIHPMIDMGNGKSNFTPIDNIFVKGNIKIRNVEVLADDWENLNSDHIPLIADLVIF